MSSSLSHLCFLQCHQFQRSRCQARNYSTHLELIIHLLMMSLNLKWFVLFCLSDFCCIWNFEAGYMLSEALNPFECVKICQYFLSYSNHHQVYAQISLILDLKKLYSYCLALKTTLGLLSQIDNFQKDLVLAQSLSLHLLFVFWIFYSKVFFSTQSLICGWDYC